MRIANRGLTRLALGSLWITAATLSPAWGESPGAWLRDGSARSSLLQTRATPREEALLADAADGRWNAHDLLSAVLVAEGVDDPAEFARLRDVWGRHVEQLQFETRLADTRLQRMKVLFEYLHREMLRGEYDSRSSSVSVALDRGDYNCLSATALLHSLAAACGDELEFRYWPGHVASQWTLDDREIPLEITCPTWFDGPLEPDSLARREPGAAGERNGPGRGLTEIEFVALVYYNRGVELLEDGEFPAALAANVKALQLDPRQEPARANLLATLNNWSLNLSDRGRHMEAEKLLQAGLQIDPSYSPFRMNLAAVGERRRNGSPAREGALVGDSRTDSHE